MPIRVLTVDDDAGVRFMYGAWLEEEDVELHEAATGEEALALCASERFDLVLLDHQLPGISGIDVAEALHAQGDTVPMALCTGYAAGPVADRARELGVPVIDKSDLDAIVALVRDPSLARAAQA